MIHVLFTSSGAGTLRQVLNARRKKERVVDLTEWLDWGPIVRGTSGSRGNWLNNSVPGDVEGKDWDWRWVDECLVEFRRRLAADSDRLIWIAPRSASELSGLHWYLDQFGGTGTQFVIADFPLQGAWRGEPPFTLGELGFDQMAELLDQCPRSAWEPSRFPADRWRTLVDENALLRLVQDGELRSAPEDHFDPLLLRQCSANWVMSRRVIGDTMVGSWDCGHTPNDVFLFWRLRELIRAGRIESSAGLPVYPFTSEPAVLVRCCE